MRRLAFMLALSVLAVFHVVSLGKATREVKELPRAEESAFVLPAPFLKITALEYDGLASDFLFLKSLVFIGSTFERTERPRVKEWEWKWLYGVLDASTGLDPYFYDPYYFGNASLAWDGGKAREADLLLKKGTHYREWDWRLPFFLGFNLFYFLQETDEASEYLMEASRRPDGKPMFASLASRLAYKGRKTEKAILLLEEVVKATNDQDEKQYYETRIEALKAIHQLETAIDRYRAKFGRIPIDINELVAERVISHIPRDPYGGRYYLDPDGAVKTTSDSMLLPFHR